MEFANELDAMLERMTDHTDGQICLNAIELFNFVRVMTGSFLLCETNFHR